jgi:hypothetical protein
MTVVELLFHGDNVSQILPTVASDTEKFSLNQNLSICTQEVTYSKSLGIPIILMFIVVLISPSSQIAG